MYKVWWSPLVILALVACGDEPRTVAVPTAPMVEVVSNDHIAELIEKFPIQPRMLSDKETIKELARLKLHPVILERDTIMLNYFREIRKFVRDTIRAGQMVYADESGMIRYKSDCWNLLADMSACQCNVLPATATGLTGQGQRGEDLPPGIIALSPTGDVVEAPQGGGFWEGVGEKMRTLLGWFLVLLLALALLAILAIFARALLSGQGLTPQPAVPPAPVAPPAPLPHEGGRRRYNVLPIGVGRRHGERDRRHINMAPEGFGRRRGERERRGGNDRRGDDDRRRGY